MKLTKKMLWCAFAALILTTNTAFGNSSSKKASATAENAVEIQVEKLTPASLVEQSPFKVNYLPYSISTQQKLPDDLFMVLYIHNDKLYIKIGGADKEKRLIALQYALDWAGGYVLSEKAETEFIREGWICAPFDSLNSTLEAIADGKSPDNTPGFDLKDNLKYRYLFKAVNEIATEDIRNELYVKNYNKSHEVKISKVEEIPDDEDIEEIDLEELYVSEKFKMPDTLPFRAILIADGAANFSYVKDVLKNLSYSDFYRVELMTSEIEIDIDKQTYSQQYQIINSVEYFLMPMGNFFPYEHLEPFGDEDIRGIMPITIQVTGEQLEYSFPGNSYCRITYMPQESKMPIFDGLGSNTKSLTTYLHEICQNWSVLVIIDPLPNASYGDVVTLISALKIVGIDRYMFNILPSEAQWE